MTTSLTIKRLGEVKPLLATLAGRSATLLSLEAAANQRNHFAADGGDGGFGVSWISHLPKGTTHVVKPNYQFEKRQREQEKKRKKVEKAHRKASQPDAPPPSEVVPEKK